MSFDAVPVLSEEITADSSVTEEKGKIHPSDEEK